MKQGVSLLSLPGIGGLRPTRSMKRPGIAKGVGRGGTDARCTVCGVPGHSRKECRRQEKECNCCGKVGHLAKVCREAKDNQTVSPPRKATPTVNTRKVTPEVAFTAVVKNEAPWYCQECGVTV